MTKYLAIAFLITGFLVGDAYGEDEEVFYCADIAGAVVASPVSWAGKLEDAQEKVRQNPNDAIGNIFVLAPPGFSLPLHVIEWFRCLPYDDLGKRQLILKSNQEHTL